MSEAPGADTLELTPGERLIEGAREALAIARGEIPAARITINGHAYVPEAEAASLRAEKEELRREHAKALALGGEHRERNLRPALKEPHKAKTSEESEIISKADRIRLWQRGELSRPSHATDGENDV